MVSSRSTLTEADGRAPAERRWNWQKEWLRTPPLTNFRGAAGVADDRGGQSADRPVDGESLMATVAQSDKEAKAPHSVCVSLDHKTAKVKPT